MKTAKPKPESLTSKVDRLFGYVNDLVTDISEIDDRITGLPVPEPDSHFALWLCIGILALAALGLLVLTEQPLPVPPATVFEAPMVPKVSKVDPATLVRTGGIRLQLTLTRECWYEGTSDGQKIPGHTGHAGETRNIGAEHEIEIRSGCPGGIDFVLNGIAVAPINLSNNPKIFHHIFVASLTVPNQYGGVSGTQQ